MKIINLSAIILIISIGCTTTVSNDVSTLTNGGKILNGPNAGSTYTFASDEVGQLAIDFSNAFVRKDMSFISTEHFTDSIFFYPEKGLEKVVMDLETGKKLIQAMHEPYDSITRWVYDVMPVVPSYDKELTIVMFPFTCLPYFTLSTIALKASCLLVPQNLILINMKGFNFLQ